MNEAADEAIARVPAPWNLCGQGYIIIYRFDHSFLASQGVLPLSCQYEFAGGLGAVMLVDYQRSNAGPYQELLFIPGQFKLSGKKWYRITNIYVSTQLSVVNGRENWGIPKQQAVFSFSPLEAGVQTISVSNADALFFQATLKPFGLRFPITTAFMPFPLMQEYQGQLLQTTFSGHGWGRLAKLKDISIDQRYFPNIGLKRPLAVIAVK
jgi:hypothetical protein